MANEFYTLIVVPHAKARFRQIRVPVRLAKWTLTLVGIVGFAVVGVMVHCARGSPMEINDLRRLRTENSELLTKTRTYEENAGKLQAKVLQLQTMVTKLGVMAGLEHSLPEAGIGRRRRRDRHGIAGSGRSPRERWPRSTRA